MYTRTNPYHSRILERGLLTGTGSTKKTYHLSLDISGSHFPFKVGDSIGVIPTNDFEMVEEILAKTGCTGKEEFLDLRSNQTVTCREYLLKKANLSRVNSSFLKLLRDVPENKGEINAYLDTYSLLDLLALHPPVSFSPSDFGKLMPLMPRFYSIASSEKYYPEQIHLTVAHIQYSAHGRVRHGVGSHFLCDMAELEKTAIPIYLQSSNHFTLPENPEAPIILIGPGTGIAPFRAFLQERMAMKAPGKNWLFYGERNRKSDFYYSDFFLELEKQGRIRLDLAFSRDQAEKVYVQHKMLEQKEDLWDWIASGSYLYVCGDAEKMAKDVDAALHKIVREEGAFSEEDARHYIKKLRTEKRYLLDVY